MGKSDPKELQLIVETLHNGGTMLYPSDTLWALGCDAENETAIEKVAVLKGNSEPVPMVSLVGSLKMLLHYVPQLPPKAGDLIEYYEKPLTILYDNCRLPDKLKAADGSCAIRLVKDSYCASIINSFGKALLSTMANTSEGKLSKSLSDVPEKIKKGVDVISSFNTDYKGDRASVMIRINSKNELVFLRKDY